MFLPQIILALFFARSRTTEDAHRRSGKNIILVRRTSALAGVSPRALPAATNICDKCVAVTSCTLEGGTG